MATYPSTFATVSTRLQSSSLPPLVKRRISDILEGRSNYVELWFGSATARDATYAVLHGENGIFSSARYLSITLTKKVGGGKEYFIIEIRKITGKEVIKKKEQPKPLSTITKIEKIRDEFLNFKKEANEFVTNLRKENKDYATLYSKAATIFGEKITASAFRWSAVFEIDPKLLFSIIVAEHSGKEEENAEIIIGRNLKKNANFYTRSIGRFKVKSYGLMQLTKNTFNSIKKEMKKEGFPLPSDLTFKKVIANYDISLLFAAFYLSYMKRKHGYKEAEKLAAAYNLGPYSKLLQNEEWKKLAYVSKFMKQYIKLST